MRKVASLAKGSKALMPSAPCARALKELTRSSCGWATADVLSALRRKETCLPSSMAVSAAYAAMVGMAKGTLAKLGLVTTTPCVQVPVMPIGVDSLSMVTPLTARL